MITLKRKSWHYWVATEFGDMWDCDSMSICDYLRYVGKGMLRGAFLLIIIGSLLAGLIDAIYYWYQVGHAYFAHTKYPAEDDIAYFITGVVIAVSMLTVYALFKEWREDVALAREVAREQPKQPSFIAEAFKSITQKACVKISFK
jgi:hypothetical protein